MSASISVSPASGSITAKITAANISCAEAPNNTTTGYDPTARPSEPQVSYHFRARKSGSDDLISETFSTNPAGSHTWLGVVFPAAGTWAVTLRDAADAQIATANVVVN